jgi:VCBS repeat-containing protein
MKLIASDADGEPVTFKIVTPPKLADAAIDPDGLTLKVTPKADVHGEDVVVVEASDGKDKTRASLPILVAAKNDAPTVDAVAAKTLEETPLVIALIAHDKDGDAIELALPVKQANGVTLVGNTLRVLPALNFAGEIAVDVVASDATGAGPAQKIVIVVENVNDAPAIKDRAITIGAAKSESGTADALDPDAGDELTYSIAVAARQGTATIDDAKTGKFTYTANADAKGTDSFRIRVKDKAGASSSCTVKVTIASPPPPGAPKTAPPPTKPPPKPAPGKS